MRVVIEACWGDWSHWKSDTRDAHQSCNLWGAWVPEAHLWILCVWSIPKLTKGILEGMDFSDFDTFFMKHVVSLNLLWMCPSYQPPSHSLHIIGLCKYSFRRKITLGRFSRPSKALALTSDEQDICGANHKVQLQEYYKFSTWMYLTPLYKFEQNGGDNFGLKCVWVTFLWGSSMWGALKIFRD